MEQYEEEETPDVTLELPPEPAAIRLARMFAASLARHFGCAEDSVEDLKIAMSEACTNSVKAHHAAGIEDSIRIGARPEGEMLVFTVVDAGAGIEGQTIDPAFAITPPSGLFEGSLGLTLIRSLFPDATVARNVGPGTTVRFSMPVATSDDLS